MNAEVFEGNSARRRTLYNHDHERSKEEQIDLNVIFHTLLLSKKLILFVTLICFLGACFFLFEKPVTYTANILLQIEDHNAGLGGLDKTGIATVGVKAASPADIQSVLIKSRYILEPVAEGLGLDLNITPVYFPLFGRFYARYHSNYVHQPFLGLSRYAWGGEVLKIGLFRVPPMEERRRYLLIAGANNTYRLFDRQGRLILQGVVGKVETVTLPAQGVFSIQVTSLMAHANTHFSIYKKSMQPIVTSLASKLIINDLASVTQYAKTGVLQMSTVGENPEEIVRFLNMVAQITVVKDIEKKSEEAVKTLEFLSQQLPQVKQSLDQAEIVLNQYRSKTGTIDLSAESTLLLNQISEQQKLLEEVRVDRATALQKYTPEHPYVLTLNDKEKALESELAALKIKASKLPESDQAAVSLMRDVRVKSQLYLLLLNKIQALRVTKAGIISDVRILDYANFPDAPVPVPNGVILLSSILLGFFLGVVIVLVKQALYKKISDPTLVEQKFGLANMAIVPYSEEQAEVIARHNPKLTLYPLLAKHKPKDLSMEALRSLRTSLKFAMLDATNNVITIMGVSPAVGKSFISANFAYLMADAGQKILLIDGDIRKGHLREYFQLGAPKGLSDVISGDSSFEEALIKGPMPTLDFLATGAYPPNPSELLMSVRFKELIERVSKEYDLVIIDTAPILAVTDGAVIAHHAGTNFLVLAAGAHEVAEVDLAIKRLSTNGVKLAGTIFNFSKMQAGFSGYGYNYGYNYQYKYE